MGIPARIRQQRAAAGKREADKRQPAEGETGKIASVPS
jgi:hypothetical protein